MVCCNKCKFGIVEVVVGRGRDAGNFFGYESLVSPRKGQNSSFYVDNHESDAEGDSVDRSNVTYRGDLPVRRRRYLRPNVNHDAILVQP